MQLRTPLPFAMGSAQFRKSLSYETCLGGHNKIVQEFVERFRDGLIVIARIFFDYFLVHPFPFRTLSLRNSFPR